MTQSRKISLWTGLILLIVVVVSIILAKGSPVKDTTPFVPLFAFQLKAAQAVEIENYLKEHEIEYEKVEAERAILVHESEKEKLLLDMATKGIPSSR